MSVRGGTMFVMSHADLLAFEARWPHHTPEKGQAVRSELGISPTRFYQLLQRAASSMDGIRADPITARLVRERRERSATMREERAA